MQKLYFFLLPLLFFGAAYLAPLDSHDLMEPDETRYAEIGREMLASGDWIVPRLDGVRYFEKPVLGYWLQAASLRAFGENSFAVRLPSAAAVGCTALLVFLLVWQACRRCWPKKSRKERKEEKRTAVAAGEDAVLPVTPMVTASLAALVYLSLAGVFAIGTTAVLDAVFTLFLTGSIIFFFFALESPKNTVREYGFLFLAGVFCGCAFLTKGFLALALPVLVLLVWLLWQRRFVDIFRMSWLPLLVAFIVVLPWAIQIHWWEKDFWHFFFWNEHIRRFLAEDAQHREPFWFFLVNAPAMFLPWLLLVPAVVVGFFRKTGEKRLAAENACTRLFRFSLLWLLLPLLFFSVSQGKLLTYILPCMPPFAVFMALGLSRFFRTRDRGRLFQAAVLSLGLIVVLTISLLIFIQMFGLEGLRQLSLIPGGTPLFAESSKVGLSAGALVAALFLCLLLWSKRGWRTGRAFLFGLSFLPIFSVFWYVVPDFLMEKRMPGAFLTEYKDTISEDDILLAGESSLRAVCWYFKRDDVHAVYWAGELDYGMGYDDAAINGNPRILTIEQIRALIETHPNRVVLVAREKYLRHWRKELPPPLFEASNGARGYGIMRL